MIGIIDYGMGNLFSVSKALERLDIPYFLSDCPKELEKADGLILPGVGAFRDAMKLLKEQKLDQFLQDYTAEGKPLLGICLGMQLLFEKSEENGEWQGLGLLQGRITRIPRKEEQLKIPHMGWNKITFTHESAILNELAEGYVYFVHSYYASDMEQRDQIAVTYYGEEIPAVVGRGNVFGMQFHPEKSSELGMGLLQNFTNIVKGLETIK
ncbi:glutamine amidotransferase [Bacillus pakistanensis]|uniref:Imidazole glycerol phosphate synthase subunit HisH n=1 Tax=Rossellomorea pakistanensis TaxID=992288 RepID=A0ABS2NEI7_9BACI|nr:imidazole glycerol phosphate synthase subunit HisH [Bacillus pakistanensis]MBM7585986.1 glutamine amidotransferase [Bacillus pakistanensis]